MLAVTKVLLGDPLPSLGELPGPSRSTAKTISDVRRVHESHWKCFQTERVLHVPTPVSHRPSTTVPQKKRKRKNSDADYTPHQRPEGNQSASSAARRTSRRLAVSTQSEQPSDATTSTAPLSTVTKRSSSSISTLTSASYSSFERLPTPKEPDTPDIPIYTSKPKPKEPPVPPVILPLDADCYSKLDHKPFFPLKIGFPSKDKREKKIRNHSTLTSRQLIKVGYWFRYILSPVLSFFSRTILTLIDYSLFPHHPLNPSRSKSNSNNAPLHLAKLSPPSSLPHRNLCRSSSPRPTTITPCRKGRGNRSGS